jgi:hypothetical protein
MPGFRRSTGQIAAVTVAGVLAAISLPILVTLPAGAAKAPKSPVTVTPGDANIFTVAGTPPAFPDDVKAAVLAAVAAYLKAASLTAAQKGVSDATGLATLLTGPAAARLTSTDRATLLDEGLPRATGKVKITTAPVTLTGLADPDGHVVIVNAAINATTVLPTRSGTVTVKRTGDLVFAPDNGTWKIQGYTLTSERTGKKLGVTPTTTAPAGSTATSATPATTTRTVTK